MRKNLENFPPIDIIKIQFVGKESVVMSFKKIKQRGQSMIIFTLLMPVLIVFTGAGIDLGWYYFNVSRLQNAADAAALAGARALIDNDENFSEYDVDAVRLVENILGD